MKVNRPRACLEMHVLYIGFPEETTWRCERAGTKGLVGLPSKSCSMREEEEVNRSRVVRKAYQVYLVLGSARTEFAKLP